MSQLTKAMYQLAAAWTTAPYSIQLVYYTELLRVRIGQFLNLTYSGKVHDIEELRTHVGDTALVEGSEGEFQVSPLFLEIVAPVITEMMRALVTFTAHKLATPEEMSAIKGKRNFRFLIKNFDRWITDCIKVMIPEGASEYMSKYLLEMSVRPGERQVYTRENAAGTNLSDVRFVLGKYRKIEFNALSDLKQKTFAQIIEKELPKQTRITRPGRSGYESIQLVLCLVELIEMYTKAKYYGRFALQDFIIFEMDVDKRSTDFHYVDEPLIVQLFNFFQLYYKGVVYRFDSFILSFIAWFKIIERDFKRTLRGCDINGWYTDILGSEDDRTRFWDKPSLFGSDDEEEATDEGENSDEDDNTPNARKNAQNSTEQKVPDQELRRGQHSEKKNKKRVPKEDSLSVKTAM